MSEARQGWKATSVQAVDGGMRATVWNRGEKVEIKVDWEEVGEAMFDGACVCTGECECTVEPDGKCRNGWPSALLALGLI
jgi:hypothetical protein